MQSLKVLDKVFPYILSGKKTIAIVKGHKNICNGPLVFISLSIPMQQIKFVQVNNVYYKKINELDNDEAELSGEENLNYLIKSIEEAYPDIDKNEEVTVISFGYDEFEYD